MKQDYCDLIRNIGEAKMKIKRFFIMLAAIIFILNVPEILSIKTEAYFDHEEDIYIPKGGEFKFKGVVYRVVKPRTKKRHYFGEVEIVGLDQDYDWGENTIGRYVISDISQDADYEIVGIADGAFKDNQNIRDFYGPRSLKYVGKSAFEGCTNLKKFGSCSNKLSTIKSKAFYNCKSLKKIVLYEDSLEHVGKDAFRNDKKKIKIRTIDMSVKHATKLKKLLKKAGAKKTYFKMEYYEKIKRDPCH